VLSVTTHPGQWVDCVIAALPGDSTEYPHALGAGPCITRGREYVIECDDGFWPARECNLRKKPRREDDSRQITTWDKCLWQPQGVKV
jgi:hypothetical protein